MENLKEKAYALRQDVVRMIMAGKAGHIGGDMSVMDALVALYFHEMNISPENMDDPKRDKFVMSKGHCVESLYAVLAAKGFFPIEQVIREYSQFGSQFIGHPNNKLPGIEMNSGSLGHGLPVAVGMALAERMNKSGARVYVVMGDGELAEAPYGRARCLLRSMAWTTCAPLLTGTGSRFRGQPRRSCTRILLRSVSQASAGMC